MASEALSLGDAAARRRPLTLRDVLERHGAEVWLHAAGPGGQRSGAFRFLLPAGEPAAAPKLPARAAESRPEYYDFDLALRRLGARAARAAPLGSRVHRVRHRPRAGASAGDEIISIGAVRIVNARLLKNEVFERLVNPRRP